MPSLIYIFLIDISVVVVCSIALIIHGNLRFSHPGTIYIFFHLFSFTFRLLTILIGAPALFSQWTFTDPVTNDEIARAILLADGTLIIMTFAWIRAAAYNYNRHGTAILSNVEQPSNLAKGIIWVVIAFAFPIGLTGFILLSRFPGIGSIGVPNLPETAWVGVTQMWAGLCLLALIYIYGFRIYFVGPLVLYLLVQLVQGFHRFRVVIPLLFLSFIYLDRRGERWLSLRLALVLSIAAFLYFPMKEIGQMYQAGAPITEIMSHSLESSVIMLSSGGEPTLDQFAAALTLIDEKGKWFFGREWLYSLTIMWIPRPLWENKPHMAGFLREISTQSRPMGEMGMIVSFIGDAYAHFRYFGIVAVAYFLAYWSGRACFAAYRSSYYSVSRFLYLIFACSLIQIYRDGIQSIVTFVAANMMPLFLIAVLNSVYNILRGNSGYRLSRKLTGLFS